MSALRIRHRRLSVLTVGVVFFLAPWGAWSQEVAAASSGGNGDTPTTTDFASLKSPVPYTRSSITRGETIYQHHCTECHGPDGKALIDVVADGTDLTAPKLWYSGTSEGEVFRSIRDGAGVNMPPYRYQIESEEDIWHLVNFVRSLWPESMRPQLQDEPPRGETPP